MIFISEEDFARRQDILRRMQAGELAELDAIEEMTALWPDDPIPCLLKASSLVEAGRPDEAEQWFWKGVERQPFHYMPYLAISDIRLEREPQDPVGKQMRALGVWKLALNTEVPEQAAKVFRTLLNQINADIHDPASYQLIAQALEANTGGREPDLAEKDRLRPFQILNELQMAVTIADEGIEDRLLEKILSPENAGQLIPLWRAGLRQYGADFEAVTSEVVAFMAATLGEMAGPEVADELMELAGVRDVKISLHAAWGLCRLGQRFPAKMLARYRSLTPAADAPKRCMFAEELLLMPETAGREDALADLLEGFAPLAQQPDAAYLVMVVAFGLLEAEQDDRAHDLLARSEALLPGKGRRALEKMVDKGDNFLPTLLQLELDELSIQDVCVKEVLMFDADEPEDDAPSAAKPGRNDLCWCGSGKKYKKCHLASDEESAQNAAREDEDQE